MGKRRDPPPSPTAAGDRGSLRAALAVATSAPARQQAVTALREAYFAQSSDPSLRSRERVWRRVALAAGLQPFPLGREVVEVVCGALRKAKYRSACDYLSAAKGRHIAEGFPIDLALERDLKLARRACLRGIGPPHRSEALTLELLIRLGRECSSRDGAGWAGGPVADLAMRSRVRSYVVGMWWLLRVDELLHLTVEEGCVRIDRGRRQVHLRIPESKTDAEGRGATRSHGCCCEGAPSVICPYCTVLEQVEVACQRYGLRNRTGKAAARLRLFGDASGGVRPQDQVLRDLRSDLTAIGECGETPDGRERYGTHCMRRGGAQMLARAHFPVDIIKALGRWQSDVVAVYIAEANIADSAIFAAQIVGGGYDPTVHQRTLASLIAEAEPADGGAAAGVAGSRATARAARRAAASPGRERRASDDGPVASTVAEAGVSESAGAEEDSSGRDGSDSTGGDTPASAVR